MAQGDRCSHDDDPMATFGLLGERLNDTDIDYIEIVEDSFEGNHAKGRPKSVDPCEWIVVGRSRP